MAQDPYWQRPGGGTSTGSLEGMLSTLREELERTHAVATEARELGRQALEAAAATQSTLDEVAAEQAAAAERVSAAEQARERRQATADADGASDEVKARAAAGASPAAASDDPLAAALAEFADELRAAATSRARGELGVWEAMRLLRAGFHRTRRVLGSLQRREGRHA
jgi:hypothetical protein